MVRDVWASSVSMTLGTRLVMQIQAGCQGSKVPKYELYMSSL